MRIVVAIVVVMVAVTRVEDAAACVRAAETNRVLGWSADGGYALLGRFDPDGALAHAEIHPTAFRGEVYVIAPVGDQVQVTRVPVGQCAEFPGDAATASVEVKRMRLTEASLLTLDTVVALGMSRDELATTVAAPRVRFTGKRRYQVHDLAFAGGVVAAVPVWCVGSCLRDEKWRGWRATVTATHTLASGAVLHEVTLTGVCNGGTTIRVVRVDAPPPTAPRRRCFGSGQ